MGGGGRSGLAGVLQKQLAAADPGLYRGLSEELAHLLTSVDPGSY